MSLEQLFAAILIASLLGFGGLSSLAVLQGQLAAADLPADSLVVHAVAVGNISPGPNSLYLVAVGYFVHGVVGALAATTAMLLPPFLVLVIRRVHSRLIHLRRFRTAMRSLALGVVAVMVTSAGHLVIRATHTSLEAVVLVVGAVLLLLDVPAIFGALGAIVLGLILG